MLYEVITHSHPNGEIDLIMPVDGDTRFDGRPAYEVAQRGIGLA